MEDIVLKEHQTPTYSVMLPKANTSLNIIDVYDTIMMEFNLNGTSKSFSIYVEAADKEITNICINEKLKEKLLFMSSVVQSSMSEKDDWITKVHHMKLKNLYLNEIDNCIYTSFDAGDEGTAFMAFVPIDTKLYLKISSTLDINKDKEFSLLKEILKSIRYHNYQATYFEKVFLSEASLLGEPTEPEAAVFPQNHIKNLEALEGYGYWDDTTSLNIYKVHVKSKLFSHEITTEIICDDKTLPDNYADLLNMFLSLNEDNLAIIKEKLWEFCEFCFYAIDYGADFEDKTNYEFFEIYSLDDAYKQAHLDFVRIDAEQNLCEIQFYPEWEDDHGFTINVKDKELFFEPYQDSLYEDFLKDRENIKRKK